MDDTYTKFLEGKSQIGRNYGFEPVWMPDFLFDFQQALTGWSIRKGRGALLESCGLGKTIQELVWAENVVRKTNGRVLLLTPIAVGVQTVAEGARFGIESERSSDGKSKAKIAVTNYERLHYFDPSDFVGVVCDESGILKNAAGKTRAAVTEFMRKMPYRLLATATPAPNDFIELGTSSEALGEMGYTDMLGMFFKNEQGTIKPMRGRHNSDARQLAEGGKWRFRGHAESKFWRWVCSWARAAQKPSDVGGDDSRFILPPLTTTEHVVKTSSVANGELFAIIAASLQDQRQERRRSLTERCELAAELVEKQEGQSISWCHLNDEGDLLEKLIPNCVQVSGKDSDESQEEKITAFIIGQAETLIGKGMQIGFGLNLQNCAHQTTFPSHSYEQWHQSVRRSWRFGQKNPVHVDMISSEGEAGVLKNLLRKSAAAERMFANLALMMNDELALHKINKFQNNQQLPAWL